MWRNKRILTNSVLCIKSNTQLHFHLSLLLLWDITFVTDVLGNPPERLGAMPPLLEVETFNTLLFRVDSLAPEPSLVLLLVELGGLDTFAVIRLPLEPVLPPLPEENLGTVEAFIVMGFGWVSFGDFYFTSVSSVWSFPSDCFWGSGSFLKTTFGFSVTCC